MRRITILLILSLLIVLTLVEIVPYVFTGIKEGNITISEGASLAEISILLKDNGLILDPYGFMMIVRMRKDEVNLKGGDHKLENIKNVFTLIEELKKDTTPEKVVVTIPEGFTIKDIDKRLYESGLIEKEGTFLEFAKEEEGFLYPDTYYFYKGISMQEIVDIMRKRFEEMTPEDLAEKASRISLKSEEVIILASIVEKEVKLDKDRPLAASVFLNRLKIDMPLQADSTIVYILPEHKVWLDRSDYLIDSPYNTYLYKGLPPAPISNPSIKSILAVLDAPVTPYYYFMTKPDGEAVFSETLAEHERNLEKYYGGD